MASQLVHLPLIEHLSPRVIRVLGGNPGKFTLQGTNTYLVGRGTSRVILDTGEGRPEWLQSIRSLLASEHATIDRCLLTHWHADHVGGVSDLLSLSPTPIPIHKHTPKLHGSDAWESVETAQCFEVEPGTTLRAMHCPGHTADHVAYILEEESAIFTGDNVLGQGTAVFEDLTTYMKSLQAMVGEFEGRAYPGHGPVLENGKDKITEYIEHRKQRERQILEALENIGNDGEGVSSLQIVQTVYQDVPESLYEAAQGGVKQVLEKLRREGKAACGVSEDRWRLVQSRNSNF